MRGKLIVFEGADGTGTTTQARVFADRLSNVLGKDRVIDTFEPSDDVVGQLIRKMLSREIEALPPDGMTHLFMANRANHVENVIQPALEAGKYVVCDRYYPSTIVYQTVHLIKGIQDSLGSKRVEKRMKVLSDVSESMTSPEEPEITFWLVASQMEIAARLAARRKSEGAIDDELYEGLDTRFKIAELYETFDQMFPGKFTKVDTGVGIFQTSETCWDIFEESLAGSQAYESGLLQ